MLEIRPAGDNRISWTNMFGTVNIHLGEFGALPMRTLIVALKGSAETMKGIVQTVDTMRSVSIEYCDPMTCSCTQ